MARMKTKKVFDATMKEAFAEFIIDKTAEGVSNETLKTYSSHFHSIGKFLDTDMPIGKLEDKHVKQMIADMRNPEKSKLSETSISSYVRSLKSFLSWCNANDKTQVNVKLYHAPEAVKETYTDKELKLLLKKGPAENFV